MNTRSRSRTGAPSDERVILDETIAHASASTPMQRISRRMAHGHLGLGDEVGSQPPLSPEGTSANRSHHPIGGQGRTTIIGQHEEHHDSTIRTYDRVGATNNGNTSTTETLSVPVQGCADCDTLLPDLTSIDSLTFRRLVDAFRARDSIDIHQLRCRELAAAAEERGRTELYEFINDAIGRPLADGEADGDHVLEDEHSPLVNRQVPFYVARLLEGGIRDLNDLVNAAQSEAMKATIPRASDRRLIEGKLRTTQAVEPPGAAPDAATWQWQGSVPQDGSSTSHQVDSSSVAAGDDHRWNAYDAATGELLEAAYRSGRRYSPVAGPYDQLYIVDLRLFTQTNLRTGHTRKIRRRISGVDESLLMPNSFLCPITYEPMLDPVIAADGHSYSRAGIMRWLNDHDTSPKTGLPLADHRIIPNHTLRGAVEEILYSRSLQR